MRFLIVQELVGDLAQLSPIFSEFDSHI